MSHEVLNNSTSCVFQSHGSIYKASDSFHWAYQQNPIPAPAQLATAMNLFQDSDLDCNQENITCLKQTEGRDDFSHVR